MKFPPKAMVEEMFEATKELVEKLEIIEEETGLPVTILLRTTGRFIEERGRKFQEIIKEIQANSENKIPQ